MNSYVVTEIFHCLITWFYSWLSCTAFYCYC